MHYRLHEKWCLNIKYKNLVELSGIKIPMEWNGMEKMQFKKQWNGMEWKNKTSLWNGMEWNLKKAQFMIFTVKQGLY